jgi:hypothetical protein
VSTLWIYFIVFAVLGAGIFLYAFRSLGPAQNAEKRVLELRDRAEEDA